MKGKRSMAYKVFLKTSLLLKRVLNPDKKKWGVQTAQPALAGWQIILWAKQLHRNPLTGSPRASPAPPLAGSRHVLAGSPSAAPAAPRAFGGLLVPREETWPGLAITGLPVTAAEGAQPGCRHGSPALRHCPPAWGALWGEGGKAAWGRGSSGKR